MKGHAGCCGCASHGMARRTFLAALGGTAVGSAALSGCATLGRAAPAAGEGLAGDLAQKKRPLRVQPALVYHLYQKREKTSWRPWGGLHTESDVEQELARITSELEALARKANFSVTFLPVARARSTAEATMLARGDADVMLIYAATGGGDVIETLISANRYNLVFARHKSGPVYLWYEIVHPYLLRKAVDQYGQPGLETYDVVIDDSEALLWRLRALYALKNTVGSRIVAIGGPSGWGAEGAKGPQTAVEKWKMDIRTEPYDDLAKRIRSARSDADRMRRAEAQADDYLDHPGTTLKVDKGYVVRAFLLAGIFEDLMREADCQAITVNECMSTIMPMSETTACLTLSVLNDAGVMAFCESDFIVIPSGILLHHISGLPVFLQDPTYPHDGIITLAHCTAPRKMDGKRLEPAMIVTHFESDYGAAPKVNMKIGRKVTVLDPDFASKRWIGFRGTIQDNPFLDICRSQVDVHIEGDWRKLMDDMRGFHWMLAYGDHLRETGYAIRKLGIEWHNLTADRTVET